MTNIRLSMTAIVSTLFIYGCGDGTSQSAPVQYSPRNPEQKTESAQPQKKNISHFHDELGKADTFDKLVGVEDEIKMCGYAQELQSQIEIDTARVLNAEIDMAQQKNDLGRLSQLGLIVKSLDFPNSKYPPLLMLPRNVADARFWVVNDLYRKPAYRTNTLQDSRDLMGRMSEDAYLTGEERQGALNSAYTHHEVLLERRFRDIETLDEYYQAEGEVNADKYLPAERKRLFLDHYAKRRAELIEYTYRYRPSQDYHEQREKIIGDSHLTESERNSRLDQIEKDKARWEKHNNKN